MRRVKSIKAIRGMLIAVGGGLAAAFGPVALADHAVPLTVGGLVVLLAGAVLTLVDLRRVQSEQETYAMGDTYNNSGNNFGHMGPINNHFGLQQRKLTTADKVLLSAKLSKHKPVDVTAVMGDNEALTFANEIFQYLKSDNYKMTTDGPSQGVFLEPVKKVLIVDYENPARIIVGASA